MMISKFRHSGTPEMTSKINHSNFIKIESSNNHEQQKLQRGQNCSFKSFTSQLGKSANSKNTNNLNSNIDNSNVTRNQTTLLKKISQKCPNLKSKNEEEDLEQNQSENVFENADDMDDDSNAVHDHSQIATRKKCRSTRKFCQQNSGLPSNVTIDQGQMVIDITNNNIPKEDQTVPTNASSKENRRSYKLTRPKISLSRFRTGMKSLNDGPYSQNTKIKGGTMKLKDFVNQSAQYNSGRQGNHSSILIPGIPFIGKESTINSQTNQQINDIQSEEKNCNESSNANMTNMNSNTLGSEGQVFDIESRP